jgi:hypothetical protein
MSVVCCKVEVSATLSRGVLPSVVHLDVCDSEASIMR